MLNVLWLLVNTYFYVKPFWHFLLSFVLNCKTMNKSTGVRLLANGVASCSAQASIYGKCIAANYQGVTKDMCQKEFQAFKQCVQLAVSY